MLFSNFITLYCVDIKVFDQIVRKWFVMQSTHFLVDGDHLSTRKSYIVASHLFIRGIINPSPIKLDKTTAYEKNFSLLVATFCFFIVY